MSTQPLTISQVVSSLKRALESHPDLQQLECVGEISNLTKSRAGHWYFSLKDEKAKINCVMFQSATLRLTTPIEEGDEVLVKGSMSVYAGTGQVQIIISSMKLYGQGVLYQKYLQLRDYYHKKGYFNASHKKELPLYPMSIGVIVGSASAAQADIKKTLSARWPIADVVMYESLVQGTLAPAQLISRLLEADSKNHDVLILARGGGSLEDLWAFNDGELVETIFKLNTPLISGVGHEIDITLVDYVADKRGLTPTDAAIQVTPDQNEVMRLLIQTSHRLENRLKLNIQARKSEYHRLFDQSLLARPHLLLMNEHLKVQELSQSLNRYSSSFKDQVNHFSKLQQNLFRKISFKTTTEEHQLKLQANQMINLMQSRLSNLQQKIKLFETQLELKSPLNLMAKGYIISYQDKTVITKKEMIDPHKPLVLRYQDGQVNTQVIKETSDGKNEL